MNNDFFCGMKTFQSVYQKMMTPVIKHYQLQQVEMDILLFLYNNSHYDSAKDIVEVRKIAKSHVSKGIDMLIKKGLLTRQIDQDDHRLYHLVIESKAHDIILAGRDVQIQVVKKMTDHISKEDLEIFKEVLKQMNKNLKEDV